MNKPVTFTEISHISNEEQWYEIETKPFLKSEKSNTTLLFGGLSRRHNKYIKASLQSMGFKADSLPMPTKKCMTTGKEFGNRGQCNPTYFTVGSLLSYLLDLRDNQGMTAEYIVEHYVYITASSCGPCRFGMYQTEYRKALHDAGFKGFRITSFQQDISTNEIKAESAIELNLAFFMALTKGVLLADVLNLISYRIRPYEINQGDTNKVLAQCDEKIIEAIIKKQNIKPVLKQCRAWLDKIPTNKLQAKPKISIIGEFWAMTTEGDGNYHLHDFLEKEGAECDIQPIANWILYTFWEVMSDARRKNQAEGNSNFHIDFLKMRAAIYVGEKLLQRMFYSYAKQLGLDHYKLSDMLQIADYAKDHYHTELSGGEGHMEVGKVIAAFKHQKAHLVLSIKPFGCMPSSGVSDGVQSLITKKYPSVNFIAIETSGDGEANVYSRIQMALFKARQMAQSEYTKALEDTNFDRETLKQNFDKNKQKHSALFYAKPTVAGSAANIAYAVD